MAATRDFRLFPKLPTELRQLIWKAARPPPRLVCLDEILLEEKTMSERRKTDLHSLMEPIWIDEVQYNEDRYGKDMEEEDTRSKSQKDMRTLMHKRDRAVDGQWKQQTQLHQYGFICSRPGPAIFHDLEYPDCQGFDNNNLVNVPASRNVLITLHLNSPLQRQLAEFGFVSSHPTPNIKFVNKGGLQDLTWRGRLHSSLPIPALLHTCGESRRLMQSWGYEVAFSTRCAPAQTWFNFREDYFKLRSKNDYYSPSDLSTHMWNIVDLQSKEVGRIKRVAVDLFYCNEPQEMVLQKVLQTIGNVEELLLIVYDCLDVDEDADPIFVDCREFDLRHSMYNTRFFPIIYQMGLTHRRYMELITDLSFYEWHAQGIEQLLSNGHQATQQCREPDWKIPKIRFVRVSTERAERRLRATEKRLWWLKRYMEWQKKARQEQRRAGPCDEFDFQWADELDIVEGSYYEDDYY